jgi:hypothetical protein
VYPAQLEEKRWREEALAVLRAFAETSGLPRSQLRRLELDLGLRSAGCAPDLRPSAVLGAIRDLFKSR